MEKKNTNKPNMAQDTKEQKRKNARRISRLLLLCSAAFFISGVLMLVRQYVFIPEAYVPPAAATPTPTATPRPTATLAPLATPTPTPQPTPTPYVRVAPATLHFVERQISCPIEAVGKEQATDRHGDPLFDEAGNPLYTMGTVDSEKVAAWFEEGPSPGEYGNAIINGHITWKKVAGVFSILEEMESGEELAITYENGDVKYFAVESVNIFPIDDYPAWVMSMDTGDTRLTLITCHGEWNRGAGTRNERVIVVAKPVEAAQAPQS